MEWGEETFEICGESGSLHEITVEWDFGGDPECPELSINSATLWHGDKSKDVTNIICRSKYLLSEVHAAIKIHLEDQYDLKRLNAWEDSQSR